MDLHHVLHNIKIAAANAAMAAPPAAAVLGGDKLMGMPHGVWLFIGGMALLGLQAIYWSVMIWIKVKRERERVARGQPPETTDKGEL